MSLPVRLTSTHYYRIAGRYTFVGDLFIARGCLYFFPLADLSAQREEAVKHLPHEIGLIVLVVTSLLQQLDICEPLEGLWEEGILDERFRNTADDYIERVKAARLAGLPRALPLPLRVTVDEISDLKLSLTGKLSFGAQCDTHDFNIGWRRKQHLRNALWESGLGKV